MKKHPAYYLVLFLWMILPGICIAQSSDTSDGKSEIIRDPRVDMLVSKHIRINQAVRTMDGYRIQIFSDSGNNSKNKAQSAQDEFQAKFPSLGVYLSFKSPNYRVRVGDFRSRLDAQRFLNEISADYPNAFIITDQINLPRND
jgi:hypothetical protein